MNLNEAAIAIEIEIATANKRLLTLIDTVNGPTPEKADGIPPREPGLVGLIKAIGNETQGLHQKIKQLESYLCNPNKISPPGAATSVNYGGIARNSRT